VPPAAPFRLHSLLDLPVAPCGPKQGRGFIFLGAAATLRIVRPP
jgi:hypothetical protein